MTRATPLMIFAAGFGTRMGDLTKDRPKPLIPVAGKPLIDRALDLAADAGCSPTVANAHYLADQMEKHLEGTGVRVSREDAEILDTGGGLKQALPLLGEGPVLTLNPDVIWSGPNPLSLLRENWSQTDHGALLLCVPLSRAIGRLGGGDFGVDELGGASRGGDLVFGGAQMIRTEIVAEQPERVFSLNRIWDHLISENRLQVLEYPGHWCDVGRPDGIVLAERMLAGDV